MSVLLRLRPLGLLQYSKTEVNVFSKKLELSFCVASSNATRHKYSTNSGRNNGTAVFDYEKERKNFRLDVPKYFNFAADVIDSWAEKERTGKRDISIPAFWWIDDKGSQLQWNFQELSSNSKRVARLLTEEFELSKGDKLILILSRIPEWWLINLACIRAGIILSAGTTLLRAHDIQHRLLASQAKCIITDSNIADMVDKVIDNCPDVLNKVVVADKTRDNWKNFNLLLQKYDNKFKDVQTLSSETMMLFFTSGTTGAPKMAEHTHSSYGIGHKITAEYFLRLTSKDVIWNMSDTGWAKSAWSNLFAPWTNGSCVFIHHSVKFDARVMLQNLCKFPISHCCTAPTAYRTAVKLPLCEYKFHSLKYCFGAGEPVNPELIEEWQDGTGLRLYEGYGQTETTFLCGTNYPGMEYRAGSMGKPPPGYDLQIVDDEGNILPPEQEGNIAVRCKPDKPVGLFTKYLDDSNRTKSVFVGDFYLTGDRGKVDDDGYFYFIGRADDVILSAGYRIGPFEVESALLEHPSVLESAVVSSPDDTRGEIVKAFVILTDKYKTTNQSDLIKELQNHVKQSTAPYKYPRKIEFVENLPKTVSGKIRRVELRNKEWGKN
ncbi:acyl-coenzyme A synthetase ACSM3, mitochondrial [Patella vulgata]|uniref:acyl-coenzyme A synthetase ACSM3, mitochondrial n=1 Tax=Patella vulgata TaxID=6465 RepID=UPI0024A91A8C|nr:acyl-coenzyme A synthetase ACSM3, mitochondrial [Patella vulgata]